MNVAPRPRPENNPTKGSVPPGAIRVPAWFVPPPKPYVWSVTSEAEASVNVTSNVSFGLDSVPTYEVPVLSANAGFAIMARTANSIDHLNLLIILLLDRVHGGRGYSQRPCSAGAAGLLTVHSSSGEQ